MEKAVDVKKKSFELWEHRRRAVDMMHGECVAKPVVKVEPVNCEVQECECDGIYKDAAFAGLFVLNMPKKLDTASCCVVRLATVSR